MQTSLLTPFGRILRAALAGVLVATSTAAAARWNLSPGDAVIIDSATTPFNELSGVTYVGPAGESGHHEFLAVQDDGGKVITLDVELGATGALVSAKSTAALTLSTNLDFEGIAYTNAARGSAFVSEENGPGVREFNLSTGAQLQSVAIPSVFTNRRSNYGFESLTRSPDGNVMWTGNEEALTVDGSRSTASVGTTIRILRMDVEDSAVTATKQYAYVTDPIHVVGLSSQRRSGLSDLVALPDGTLLALERSFDASLTAPPYRSSVYEVDASAATDISVAPYATGLAGQTFMPVGKELLWSGQSGTATGQNLEGLCLGPRLANGNWLLVGVIDNSSGEDPVSFNTLVTYELSANVTADFDSDGHVDGHDFLAWQRGFGTLIGAELSQGDGDRDGDVDAADLALWSAGYGAAGLTATTVPEPHGAASILIAVTIAICRRAANYIVSFA